MQDPGLECELIDRRRFAIKAEVRLALFQHIEGFSCGDHT